MSTTSARLALLCALVGLGAAGAAAWVHYRMFADPTYTSFCDVSTTVSCTQVYASRFGTFKGVSVSVFGGIWFAFAALLSVAGMSARESVRESVPGYLFAASTLALAVILYLGYASFVILKLVCVLCLTTYAAVIGLFLKQAEAGIVVVVGPINAAGLEVLTERSDGAEELALFDSKGTDGELDGAPAREQEQRFEQSDGVLAAAEAHGDRLSLPHAEYCNIID